MDTSEIEFKYNPNKKIKKEDISQDVKPPIIPCETVKTEEIPIIKCENTKAIKLEPPAKLFCPYCPFRSNSKNQLGSHIIDKHTIISDTTWYKCSQCTFESETRDELKSHVLCMHKFRGHQCPHCPFNTQGKGSLHNHIVVKHTPDEEIQWFQCGLCDYRGKCRHHLINHFKSRHLENLEIFQCPECEYSAKFKRNLLLHVKSRHSALSHIKLVKCDFCSYRTKRKYYLKLHMMSKHPVIS